MMENRMCLYKILFNGMVLYIGITKNPERRFKQHQRNNSPSQIGLFVRTHLDAGYQIDFQIIEWVAKGDATKIERTLIDNYKSIGQCLFNDVSNFDIVMPKSRVNYSRFKSDSNCAKPILQICKTTGNIIEEFKSVVEANDKYNYKKSNISMCLTGTNKSAYGYVWRYKQ